jgi:hypothetical protein
LSAVGCEWIGVAEWGEDFHDAEPPEEPVVPRTMPREPAITNMPTVVMSAMRLRIGTSFIVERSSDGTLLVVGGCYCGFAASRQTRRLVR